MPHLTYRHRNIILTLLLVALLVTLAAGCGSKTCPAGFYCCQWGTVLGSCDENGDNCQSVCVQCCEETDIDPWLED